MRYILLIGFLVLCAFSKQLNHEVTLKQCINLIDKKEYKKAYKNLNLLYEKDLTNKDVNFFLALVLLELKEFQKAQVIYERLSLEYPKEEIFKFKLAQVYYMQNMKELSLDTLKGINENKVSNNLKEKIVELKEKIAKNIKNYFFTGNIKVGFFYDDNINNNSFNNYFYVPGLSAFNNGILQNDNDEVETYGTTQSLDMNYIYKKKKDLFILNTSIYNKSYKNHDEENLQIISLSPKYIKQYTDKFFINYSVFVDHIFEDEESSMTIYGLNPSLGLLLKNDYFLNAFMSTYIKKTHLETNEKEDSTSYETGISLSKNITKNLFLQNSISYRKEVEKYEEKDNINKRSLNLSVFSKYRINDKINFGSNLDYKVVNFKDVDVFYLEKRKDRTFSFGVFGNYDFNKKQNILLSYQYTNNYSNFDSQEYKKNTISLSYTYKF